MQIGDRNGGDPIERLRAGALAHRRPQKTRGCPDEDRLRLLLPGQVEPEEAEELLTHAAECDWCGTVLREAAQDLSEPPTGEEERLAAKGRLSNPRARRKLVERIVPRNAPPPPIFRWWPAAAMATLVLGSGVSYEMWARGPAHTERLLAEAYTEDRLMEARVPGAEWGKIRTEMGVGSSSLNEPRELMDAKSNISRGREAHPGDPRWLQLAGEAELLGGNEDAAIADLERAQALHPGDASILLDWGAALFQKAEKGYDAKGRAEAFERFTEGCRLKPDDPELLFNRALAAQSLYSFNVAADAWQAYLRIDSRSRWAQEARQHLDEVKKNLSEGGPTPPSQPPAR